MPYCTGMIDDPPPRTVWNDFFHNENDATSTVHNIMVAE